MAQRRVPGSTSIELKQFTTSEEVERAISKLTRRLQEIKSLDPKHIRHNDQEVRNIEERVRDAILEIFGSNSPEYNRHGRFSIEPGIYGTLNDSDAVAQERFGPGIVRAVTLVEGLIKNLEEKRADFGYDSTSRVRAAFNDLDLHSRIADVSVELFQGGHYRNAVLDAAVALVNFVKEKSRRHDLDGADLMRKVFSKNNPILRFNELKDQSDMDEQEGLMHLFEGAVLALRNPRAHDTVQDAPEDALEYIGFLSFLAKQLDRAKRMGTS